MIRQNRKYKNLTFTFDEWNRIKQLAAGCKMKTATYIKQMALNGRIINIDMKAYHQYIAELNKIGSNINQIARIANSSGYVTSDEMQWIERFREDICHISKSYLSEIQSQVA